MLGDTLEVRQPVPQSGNVLITLSQTKEVCRVMEQIVDNLTDGAIYQLNGGSNNDLDKLLNVIFEETYKVIYGESGAIKDSNYMYLEKLAQSVDETLLCENLNYFITSVLDNFEMNWHHIEWGQWTMRYNKLAIEAARDHGKSHFFSHAVPIWKMFRYKSRRQFAQRYLKELATCEVGYIITNEEDLGKLLLENIKLTIEDTPLLRERLYPINKEKWSETRIKCKNQARLSIKTYGGSFRGRHPGYIIVDDLLKDNVIYSELQRRKATDYFHSVIMNAVIPGGQTIVVGTPFHQNDLYGDLKTKRGWKVFEYPAIFPDGKLLWSNRHTYVDLIEKRETQGNLVFSRENLCRPIVSDSSIFPFDILQRSFIGMDSFTLYNNLESVPKDLKFTRVVTGCDFAISSSVGADYSVFGTWGITNDMRMHLIHFWRGGGKSYYEQIAILKSIYLNFKPDIIVTESNQFQVIFAETLENDGLPVVGHNTGTNKNDLIDGLPGIAVMFERGRICLPRGDEFSRNVSDLICSEFSSVAFTDKGLQSVGQHDDTCMMTWLAKKAMDMRGFGGFGVSFL